mgnify:CR=1 FL=1
MKKEKHFKFGKNWKNFLSRLNNERIKVAEKSLKEKLKLNSLDGKSFLDIGCGSGLFSLAARNLGANVLSFDYDKDSVACTEFLKNKYYPQTENWRVTQASVLDKSFMKSIGKFDVVYSWGVLHHTGDMLTALANVDLNVRKDGLLFIAIYNDQSTKSKRWKSVKKLYCKNLLMKFLIKISFIPYFIIIGFASDLTNLKNPFSRYKNYKQNRGMSILHDWIDWLGGYPFEVAKPEKIFNFYYDRHYELVNLKTCGNSHGCNEYVLKKG